MKRETPITYYPTKEERKLLDLDKELQERSMNWLMGKIVRKHYKIDRE